MVAELCECRSQSSAEGEFDEGGREGQKERGGQLESLSMLSVFR